MTTIRDYTPEEAQARFETLPPTARDAVYSEETEQVLTRIGQKHQLHIDQLSILREELNGVMLGFTEPQDFTAVLAEALHVDEKTATAITADIDTEILSKIRDSMKAWERPAIEPAPSEPPAVHTAPHPAENEMAAPAVTPEKKSPEGMLLDVDRELSGPSISTPKIVDIVPAPPGPSVAVRPPSPPPAPQPTQPNAYKVDPYHEPVE